MIADTRSADTPRRSAALTLAALGVVFGDIGTSPLYAMREVFGGHHALSLEPSSVYGIISVIFWAVTIVVTLKYVLLIMRADNEGEGGIMALIALLGRLSIRSARSKRCLLALGVFGAALFYGDVVITPAISMLAAVEGVQVVAPGLESFIVPVSVALVAGLFTIQRFGTAAVGKLFGPIMLVWFSVIGGLGLAQVLEHPQILKAISPVYALSFSYDHGLAAFLALGSVVLAITGAEALYADVGHFGRRPIQRAWFFLVFPALMLNYMGQGALLLAEPAAIEGPFFLLAPEWARVGLIALATLAVVTASQAVISGAFSITNQAMRLGFLPMLKVQHTSTKDPGQIYVPTVNKWLWVSVIALVVGFGSSSSLAAAYGIAMTGVLAVDTLLAAVVIHVLWGVPRRLVLLGAGGFLFIDLSFFLANVPKMLHGGWLPIAIATALFAVLTSWQRCKQLLSRNRLEREGQLEEFLAGLGKAPFPVRVPGTAVFLNADPVSTPLALRHNVEHNRVLHEQVVVITVQTLGVPSIPLQERVRYEQVDCSLGGVYRVTAAFGFDDQPDVPEALQQAVALGLPINLSDVTYFITRSTVTPKAGEGIAMWRKRLFVAINRNASSGVRYFGLPEEDVVALGSSIRI